MQRREDSLLRFFLAKAIIFTIVIGISSNCPIYSNARAKHQTAQTTDSTYPVQITWKTIAPNIVIICPQVENVYHFYTYMLKCICDREAQTRDQSAVRNGRAGARLHPALFGACIPRAGAESGLTFAIQSPNLALWMRLKTARNSIHRLDSLFA